MLDQIPSWAKFTLVTCVSTCTPQIQQSKPFQILKYIQKAQLCAYTDNNIDSILKDIASHIKSTRGRPAFHGKSGTNFLEIALLTVLLEIVPTPIAPSEKQLKYLESLY